MNPAKPIVRHQLLTAVLEGQKRIDRVEVKRIQLSPGQQTGLHLHPCPVIGIVMSGNILFQIDGESTRVARPGEAIFEPANAKILHYDAIDGPATFVALYLMGADENALIEMLD